MRSWKLRSPIVGTEVARLNEVNFLRAVAPRQPRSMSAMRLPAPQPLQMTLFPRDEENLIATVVFEAVPFDFVRRLVSNLRPGAIFDLRVSPRFDYGGATRRTVLDWFKTSGALYYDLSGEIGALRKHDARLNPVFVGETVRDRVVPLTNQGRSLIFLIDERNDTPTYVEALLDGVAPDRNEWNWMRVGGANQVLV